ncbi:MAG: Rne/Rng family ribonuclease [Bacteroidetes bacterium]|nr:Rne/Rng family ribonuclease [Bacteroidota bacterium]
MSSELIINSTQSGCRIALLKDKNLVEFHHEKEENAFTVGDIYLGSVKKLVPGLNAAFIDIGYEKDAFLHYLDLGPQIRSLTKFTRLAQTNRNATPQLSKLKNLPDIDKLGKISQVLSKNQQILTQVVKEPISTKGPRLSCELSIAGRYIVLVPFSNAVSISKRITDRPERKRLTRLLSSIKPENFGIIIRTVAQGKNVTELDKDLRNLVEKWDQGVKSLSRAVPRDKIIGEMGRASSLLRDLLNESFDSIVIDDQKVLQEIKSYVQSFAPEKQKIIKSFQGKAKLFEQYGIEKQLKSLFGQSVNIPGGGYLIIEHTEAMHVIDVNSGNKSNVGENQESTALKVNSMATKEVARQLKLRDMGGIIVVDFIDMKKSDNKRTVFNKMKEEMKSDRSRSTILPLSKFGLMQITRQRVRPELNITTQEKCPTCDGTGSISPSILVSDQIESKLEYLLNKQNEKKVTIALHPYLHAYFTSGVISPRIRWFLKYLKWVKLEKDSSLGMTDYKFLNGLEEEIALNPN